MLSRLTPLLKPLGLTKLAILLLSVGFLAFVMTAVEASHSMTKMIEYREASREAIRVKFLIEESMSLLKDLETGQRGFIITGQETYLEPYHLARAQFHQVYEQMLVGLGARNSHIPAYDRLSRLDMLIQQRMNLADRMVAERRLHGSALLQNITFYSEGKLVMDEIRAEMKALQDHQVAIGEMRRRTAREVQEYAVRVNLWLTGLGAMLILLAIGLLVHEKRQRDRAEKALQSMNASLESIVARRTAELSEALGRIKAFASELDCSIETERRRLAREVHDQIGQVFTALGMLMLESCNSDAHPAASRSAAEARKLLDEGIAVARRITGELRPALLDDFGLEAAVAYYAENFTARGGLPVTVNISDEMMLTPMQANQLFRIIQEAITNVARHAQASQIHITDSFAEEHYRLVVADNGQGPGPIRADASGIRNMRERAALAGGTLTFDCNAQGGASVTVRLAIAQKEREIIDEVPGC